MLTLAFAQSVWSIIFRWDELTGGSNGIIGVWPSPWLASKAAYFYLTLALCVAGVLFVRRILFAPFGYAMRAVRDSSLRADAIGIGAVRIQWTAFIIAGAICGIAGGLFAFSKGSISPETISISRSVDGLAMVLLGRIGTLVGPIVGSVTCLTLQHSVARQTASWRPLVAFVILLNVHGL